ncbi:ABC transporter ATP-binding protein [Vallitalea pronyensis]|uniref:ABC transporter ATP-binding protein n=1 Tax=Vallitalea pronyensis TaxID=1348613 RepID=A0A8J8MG98_9FIRM|nr:ABC transporter ATP-binding protein [Vallitalea pronyensis]QUI21242.1 ABC transporter ATP-binding protein [Vallitalea pronyensis]
MIQLHDITKTFNQLKVFENFNMTIPDKKISCFLGASGCGKSTLLNMIAGIMPYDQGSIDGIEGNQSYIFQDTRLLPWATVEENIRFVLKSLSHINQQEVVDKYLNLVKLTDYRNYYPKELSGGMKQRVTIARAFAYPSNVLLMDEPFKGLNPELKNELMTAFMRLWQRDRRTVLFVTHDVDEALLLADEIYQLKGRPVYIESHVKIDMAKDKRNDHWEALQDYREQLF